MTTSHKESARSYIVLAANTLAFTVCFAAWMLNGVLVTFLVDNNVFAWDAVQVGWLIGVPVLTGSIMRLPVGMLTDRYGGRPVYTILLLLSAIPMFLLGTAQDFTQYLLYSFGFGLSGAAFAVGIAFSSVWFVRQHQGTALGVFGMGNAGSAITTLAAPSVLNWLTAHGGEIERWRLLPQMYAVALLLTAVIFFLVTTNRKPPHQRSFGQMLQPLRYARVWRFGLYYFLVFGGFVALAQWLVPYYVNVYSMSLVTAGLLATIFSLPSGVIRALGGWISDVFGARMTMYWVLGVTAFCCLLLFFPRMDIQSPGNGVTAIKPGVVTKVTPSEIVVDSISYPLTPRVERIYSDDALLLWPLIDTWHEPAVKVGDTVARKQLLARGVTHIYFQANVWVFTVLVFIVGIAMGIGKAAVYKYIPDYYPEQVGVVGGIVGVIGGLGGFVCPIIFGYLLKAIGLWTTTWMFFFLLAMVCLVWLHIIVLRVQRTIERDPALAARLAAQPAH